MKISITGLDKKFSQYIRARDNWTCQRCFKRYVPPTNALHCSHIFSRRNKSTRFDPDNAVALCYGCHSHMDTHPLEKYRWYEIKYGRSRFQRILVKSHQTGKVDEMMVNLWLTEKLKQIHK